MNLWHRDNVADAVLLDTLLDLNLRIQMIDAQLERHTDLWDRIIRECGVDYHGIHGPQHWARVERNGLYLAHDTGADPDVITMFALFHDSCRINDAFDPGHGGRGAEYARTLRHLLDFLADDAFETLVFACTWHTDMTHHEDPTVQACFDADRLDLGRVGIIPAPPYLNTGTARSLAGAGRLAELDALPIRSMEHHRPLSQP